MIHRMHITYFITKVLLILSRVFIFFPSNTIQQFPYVESFLISNYGKSWVTGCASSKLILKTNQGSFVVLSSTLLKVWVLELVRDHKHLITRLQLFRYRDWKEAFRNFCGSLTMHISSSSLGVVEFAWLGVTSYELIRGSHGLMWQDHIMMWQIGNLKK